MIMPQFTDEGYPKQCSTSKYHSNWYPPILPTINKHDSTGGFGVSPGFTVLLSMPWHHSSGLQEASLKPRRLRFTRRNSWFLGRGTGDNLEMGF